MKRVLIAAPLMLAACHSAPSVTAANASTEEVSAKVAAAAAGGQFVSPGHWDSTMTIKEMTIPGMPPEMASRMMASTGQGRTFASCLTAEEARKPKEGFFGGGDKSCRYEHFAMGGGKIDAVMHCSADKASRTMTMTGSYSPDAYHMTVTSKGSGPASSPMAGMSMKMEMDARRTGPCTGKEDG